MANSEMQHEYTDVSHNVRHFQTVRFAQLTIFIALTGGILKILFDSPNPQLKYVSVILKCAGILITLLFWILQERTMLYWRHFVARATELEQELGYRQYSTRPREGWLTGTNAVRAFYFILLIFWIVSLFGPS